VFKFQRHNHTRKFLYCKKEVEACLQQPGVQNLICTLKFLLKNSVNFKEYAG